MGYEMMQTHLYMAIKRFGENTWDDSDAASWKVGGGWIFGCWSEVEFTAKTAQHTPVKKRLVKYCVQAIEVAHGGERTIPPFSQSASLMV